MLNFKDNGTPTAVPANGYCPLDWCVALNTEDIGFCEVDWRWEGKIHLREKTHGLIKETEGRYEPIIQQRLQATIG